jgi:hypothetical protein
MSGLTNLASESFINNQEILIISPIKNINYHAIIVKGGKIY